MSTMEAKRLHQTRTLQRLVRQLLGRDACMDRACILRDPECAPLGQVTNGGCSCLVALRYEAVQARKAREAAEKGRTNSDA